MRLNNLNRAVDEVTQSLDSTGTIQLKGLDDVKCLAETHTKRLEVGGGISHKSR